MSENNGSRPSIFTPAQGEIVQILFNSVSELHQTIEKLEAEIENLHLRVSKQGRIG